MKGSIPIFMLLVPCFSFAQEIRMSTYLGYSTAEFYDAKRIVLTNGFEAGIEFKSNSDLRVTLVPGVFKLMFNHSDSANNNILCSEYFLILPVTIKKYYALTRKSRLFWDFGSYISNLFYERKDLQNAFWSQTDKKYNLGFNWGFSASVGFKTTITNTIYFDLNILTQTEYYLKYKKAESKVNAKKNMLGISIYKRL